MAISSSCLLISHQSSQSTKLMQTVVSSIHTTKDIYRIWIRIHWGNGMGEKDVK